jgi:DegV family protein with EDD domain
MAEQYAITIVPIHIIMDGKDYLDTTIDKDLFYSWFADDKDKTNHPRTAAPNIGAFLNVFRTLSNETKNIVCINVTSHMGGGYKAALQAKDILCAEMPAVNVEIIDSCCEHGAQLFTVREAARAAAAGKSLSVVVAAANQMLRRVTELYLLDTIFHLTVGGRTGEANIWESSMLSLKPVLEANYQTGGVFAPLGRFRTRSQGMGKMLAVFAERVASRPVHVVITQGNAPDDAAYLQKEIQAKFQCVEMLLTTPSLVTEVHQGPKALRLGFYCDDSPNPLK